MKPSRRTKRKPIVQAALARRASRRRRRLRHDFGLGISQRNSGGQGRVRATPSGVIGLTNTCCSSELEAGRAFYAALARQYFALAAKEVAHA